MKKLILKYSLLSVVLMVTSLSAEEVKKKELPKSGSLSSSISGISASRNVPDTWGGTAFNDDNAAPITGSVSKVSPTKWVARIFNNSEDSYQANFSVNQFNRNGTKIKSDSFSHSLRGKQSVERDISALPSTEQCSLDLVSWTKKSAAPAKK